VPDPKQSGVAPPRLPEPTAEYSQAYMDDLIRTLQFFISQQTVPGPVRAQSVFVTGSDTSSPDLSDGVIEASTLTLNDLPSSASGLAAGQLYRDGTTVKIVT